MIKNLFKDYIYPIAVFCGGMVGVGFLSLPHVAMRSGIWTMLLYFLVLTAMVVAINLIFCQISLKTPDFKRFPGFVGYYLGKWPKFFAMISVILGTIGVLLAYLLVGGQFLSSVFQPIFSGNILAYVFVYFFIVSVIIYFDIKIVARVEFWVMALLFLAVLFIFIAGFSQIKLSNIFFSRQGGIPLSGTNLFLPYGPLLFALWGIGLIPEVEEMLAGPNGRSKDSPKRRLKTIITVSTIIISGFYLLFVFLILGITGERTDPTALAGLKSFLPEAVVSVALLIGALATFTAFIMQGIIFKKTLMFDLKIKHWQAFVMTCFPPLILFLLGLNSFIPLLSFVGGVLLGINGILILLMYRKIACLPAGRVAKNITIWVLSFVFILGVIYEIVYFIK